jgi:hypothetical protein
MFLKHSEIKELRKYKGRFVFQRDNVRDEFGLQQLFPDQGSGASFMTASRVMDAISLLPGCCGQQSDAPQAYAQSEFGFMGDEAYETWCTIGPEYWGELGWLDTRGNPVLNSKGPCVRLRKSLHGHPLSCKHWEHYYDNILFNCCGPERVQS